MPVVNPGACGLCPYASFRHLSSLLSPLLVLLQQQTLRAAGWRAAVGDAAEWLTLETGSSQKMAGILTKCAVRTA